MIQVHNSAEPDVDNYVAACEVVTVDATGTERWYRVSLTGDVIDGRSILAGKRIDDHEYDRTPDAPTRQAYDAAREYFRDEGFEVHEPSEAGR